MKRSHSSFIPLICLKVFLLLLTAAFAQPAQYGEAPMLAERVEAGELPPIEERLPHPEDLVVIEPVEEVGQYGGTLRMLHPNPDMSWVRLLVYDPPVRWNRDYTAYIPGLFRGWEFNEDGSSVTFFMRRGAKWSDGHPFTTEDILFYWEDLALDEDYGSVPVPWWAFIDGERATLEVIDDYTFSLHFAAPNWNMPYVFAFGFRNWDEVMAPKHFLQQFHPRYNPELEDYGALDDHRIWYQTPGFPTLLAWHVSEYRPGERVDLERNPYYWKVDTEGNQLPYIDHIISEEVTDPEVRVLRIISGEIDLSFRGADSPRNLPVIIENQERGNYRWLEGWIRGAGTWPGFVVNQDYVEEEYIRNLQRDPNFMRGLSLAIDREEVNDVIWYGLGRPQQATITEQSWHFDPPEGRQLFEEWAAWYADYDPERASEYLDRAGLEQRNSAGWRLRDDNGQIFELIIDIGSWGGSPEVNREFAALLQRFWEDIGIRVILNDAPEAAIDQRFNQGTYMVRIIGVAEMDLWTAPDWIFPTGGATRAWPMQALWYRTGGAQGEEPSEVVQRLHDLYAEGLTIPDPEDRHHLVWEAIRIHMEEGPFWIGSVAGLPMPSIARENLRNIPDFGILGPQAVSAPGNTNPEQYFFRR